MSDSNDPFAAKPYVPPTQVDDPPASAEEAKASEEQAAPAAEQAAPAAAPADTEPTEQIPAREADRPEPTITMPVAEPVVKPDDGGHGGDDGGTIGGTPPPPNQRGRRRVAGVAAVALIAAAAGVGGAAAYDAINGDDNGTVVSSLDTGKESKSAPTGDVEKVAQKLLPSVVQINVRGGQEAGSGTGIVISSDGQILTNNHVVEAAADGGSITVSFNDATNAKAEILGRDPVTDLAVIKADGKSGLTPATLGSSDDLEVGQEVVAIGSPYGLDSTVTSGIISALNRPVASSGGVGDNDQTVFPAVQTDAAINPGNSGGPLVDMEGRVIGINSAIRAGTTTSGDAGSIGLGFAIPIDLAKNVSKHLVKGEKVQHARIGVTVAPAVSSDDITGVGAEIKEVNKGSAGDKAGLKPGDIITAVNGSPVVSSNALVASIRGYQPGEKITVSYTRDGQKKTAEVTLDSDGGDLGS